MVADCPCDCHGQGVYGACSIEGGCGSLPGGCDYNPDSQAQQRRCARGDHCALRQPERHDNGAPTGAWLAAEIETERGLCEACVRNVVDALNHLPGDVVELTMLLGRGDMAAETPVSSSRDLQVPIRLGVEALRAEIDDELQNWAEPVAEQLGVDWDTSAMGHSRIAVRSQRAAALLANAAGVLLALPEQEHSAWENGEPQEDPDEPGVQATVIRDGVDGALALLDLHRRAYAAAGRTKLVHRLPTPCPWCDFQALVRHNGADEVTCENCRRHIEERHYSWFVAVLVRLEEQRQAAVA